MGGYDMYTLQDDTLESLLFLIDMGTMHAKVLRKVNPDTVYSFYLEC